MSTRQYIGARYVPKFFENSSTNDSTWASNTIYEPLTMVTYNSNVYCSKKTVPANVGNPAENSSYWAAISFTSQQINQILEEIGDIESEIEDIQDDVSDINDMFPLGVLGLEHGGTGGTTAAAARSNLEVTQTNQTMHLGGAYATGFNPDAVANTTYQHVSIAAEYSPTGNALAGMLLTFKGSGSFEFQIFFSSTSMYIRATNASGVWSTWHAVSVA